MRFENHEKLSDEDYAEAAKIHISALTEEAASSEKARREYGRWMITSLVIAHSAALAGLAKMESNEALTAGGYYFIVGLALGFASGLCASMYFAMNTKRLYYRSDPSLIFDRNTSVHVPKRLRIAILTVYIVSVASGVLSLIMIFTGANAVYQILTAI